MTGQAAELGERDRVACLAGGQGFYLTGEDSLRLTAFNAAAGVTVAIEGRYLTPRGDVVTFADRLVPTTNRLASSAVFTLGDGWLLNVHVRASAGTPRIGQCFALVEVVRGRLGFVAPIGTLLQGYVTDSQRLAWPGSPIRSSVDGPGVLRSITGTDPAAGAEISETVPTNARWRIFSARMTLVTDATVANRLANLVLDDGAAILAQMTAHANQIASTTYIYNWFHVGHAGNAIGTAFMQNFPPDVRLSGGSRIRTLTGAIQAGDNWSAPQLLVEEWIEG
jgi:hypothetical protein